MNSQQRKRVTARFARMWKRRINVDEGRRHRQENLEARDEELTPGISKHVAAFILTIVAGIALITLWLYRQ
jgi:hypothetical protein